MSVLGRGSRLIGGTVSVDVNRQHAATLLADGFFPECRLDDHPQRPIASGFQDIGLQYESDTAITRHIAEFLSRHEQDGVIKPDHVLLNGGVFQSDLLRSRLMSVVANWFADTEPPGLLPGIHDLHNAVSLGAAFYGWTRANQRTAHSRRHTAKLVHRHRNGRSRDSRSPPTAQRVVRCSAGNGRRIIL